MQGPGQRRTRSLTGRSRARSRIVGVIFTNRFPRQQFGGCQIAHGKIG